MESEILYVPEMARMYGRTEAAIRAAALRDVDWLPKPMTGMGRRVCWLRKDAEEFLRARGNASTPTKHKPRSQLAGQ